ncbi:MAG: BlaI/MecI/CopY family transcriptional regulator [Candidatus Latescibacteria bacterium]|nr:BlaI/MecI/CopY family transcriptional regulator [Candidatus Latescibacterota bacterium]
MKKTELGRVQMRIMNILWEKEKATAREISDLLNEVESIDHRNVQTLLRGLEEKGAVAYETEKNAHYYYPVLQQKKVLKQAVGTMVDNLFQGSVKSLMSFIVKKRYISGQELDKIFELFQNDIDDKK